MSRFYAKITPDKRAVMTRCANKNLTVEANGWNSGIRVSSFIDENGKDAFRIFATAGSNGFKHDRLIGTVRDGQFERALADMPVFP